jgi:hypothetical protein
MKIQLSLAERRYIYALLKLFAHNEPTQTGKMFWASLAKKLQPNQATAHLREKEMRLLLDIVEKAVHTIRRAVTKDIGQEARADILEKIMAGLKAKLETKLNDAGTEPDQMAEMAEEKQDGIQET